MLENTFTFPGGDLQGLEIPCGCGMSTWGGKLGKIGLAILEGARMDLRHTNYFPV